MHCLDQYKNAESLTKSLQNTESDWQ